MGLISRVSSRTYRKKQVPIIMLRLNRIKNHTQRFLQSTATRRAILDVEEMPDFEKHVMQAVEKANDDVDIVKIDVDDCDPLLPAKFQVSSIPMLVFFRGGEEKFKKIGLSDRGLLDAILLEVKEK